MSKSLLINFVLFQLGWFACVLGGAHDMALAGSVLAISVIAYHLYRADLPAQELSLLFLALVIGFIFESIITASGLARYSSGMIFESIAPLWMILMWPLFATTLNLSMRWLKSMPLLFTPLIGLVFAPLAYYAGNQLGAVAYENLTVSLGFIALAWAVLLPLLVIFSKNHDGYNSMILKTDNIEVTSRV